MLYQRTVPGAEAPPHDSGTCIAQAAPPLLAAAKRRLRSYLPFPGSLPAGANSHAATVYRLCHDTAMIPASYDELFPRPGDYLFHFELLEELGRGTFARVFLARQECLANRSVAVKVSRIRTDEPEKLARLCHTNIVPVYSVHQDEWHQVICMPYLGRTCLEHVHEALGGERGRGFRGEPLLVAMKLSVPKPVALQAPPPSIPEERRFIAAVLKLGRHMADALDHAHRKGILHCDIKPANILITDDGLPMLLDFNISSANLVVTGPGRVGGTLPYMAPEQLGMHFGLWETVDQRSDLYSLGAVLYQLLTGHLPHAYPEDTKPDLDQLLDDRRTEPPPVSRFLPAATPAEVAIIAHLLHPDPDSRYYQAAELREDLDRHLADRPLLYARDKSPRERLGKWRRRNPRLATAAAASLLLLLPAFIAAGSLSAMASRSREIRRAEADLQARTALGELNRSALLLAAQSSAEMPRRGLDAAREVLGLYAVADSEDWEDAPAVALLSADQKRELKAAFGEALILMARVEAREGGYTPASLRAGLHWNALAAHQFGDADRPAVLARQAADFTARLSGEAGAEKPVSDLLGSGDLDDYFDGLDLANSGSYRQALARLERYCACHPTQFRAWFARGVCQDVLEQHADAAAAFSVCAALRPDLPQPYLNRGLALLKQGQFARAEADFSRALESGADGTTAAINRALCREALGRFKEAVDDLNRALADPRAPTRIYFLRSRIRRALGDAAGADGDRARGFEETPNDPASFLARGLWFQNAGNFSRAKGDYDAALELRPDYGDALLNKAIVLAEHEHQTAEAISVLDRLLALNPDSTGARAERAVCRARLGRADARQDAERVLAEDESAFRTYQMAGVFALLSKDDSAARGRAFELLGKSLRRGFRELSLVDGDTDLDAIRSDKLFARVFSAARFLDHPQAPPK